MNPDPRKTEDVSTSPLMAMREPPGRLGDIVRRLKQAPPMPPPLAPAMGQLVKHPASDTRAGLPCG
jgi:hypothetical protein